MNPDVGHKLHNISGVAAAIIVVAVGISASVYVYNYFNSAKKDIVAHDKTIVVLKEGTGEGARRGDTLAVHYIGSLLDGTQFDNSYRREKPIEVTLGAGQVIRGWEEGLMGMKVGEKRNLAISPELAYGEAGAGAIIPPNATLNFEVELLSVK